MTKLLEKKHLLAAVVFAAGVATAMAAEPEEIVKQKRQVTEIGKAAEPLKAKLSAEIAKVVSAGRLAPFRTMYGENDARYHWRQPWQMVYALSLAMPYLPPEQQERAKKYLTDEIEARPPWAEDLLGPQGTLRQPADQSRRLFNAGCRPGKTASAFFAYALWTYADRTGDVATIRNNWQTIKTNFAGKIGTRHTLETVSGCIGMYRLAKMMDDSGTAAGAMTNATNAIEACNDFKQVIRNATRAYTGRDQWRRGTRGVLYGFLNLTPEAARVPASSPELKEAAARYAQAGWKDYPLWWMAQAPVGDSGYYGEGCCAGPEQRGMLFAYEAYVAGADAGKLAQYVDVPDALIGDCTYLRNLVIAIEAFGKATWVEAAK